MALEKGMSGTARVGVPGGVAGKLLEVVAVIAQQFGGYLWSASQPAVQNCLLPAAWQCLHALAATLYTC